MYGRGIADAAIEIGSLDGVMALKWPQAISKIKYLHAKIFQFATQFYNGLQMGCPI